MMGRPSFSAVVHVEATLWAHRGADEIRSDWVEPLCSHPRIANVVFTGDVHRLPRLPTHPKLKIQRGADERRTILSEGELPNVEGVLRLRHESKLRFPIDATLIDATLAGYLQNSPGGFFQMDLSDLPYPFLAPEVLGKDAIKALSEAPRLGLDWNRLKSFHSETMNLERGILPYEVRLKYLENDAVEYFKFPKFMALESSRLCNLRCTMCVTHSDFIDHSHLNKYPKHFDLQKYKWILDQMAPYKDFMSIAPQFQGEPFMSPYLLEMITYARQKGFLVGFTSNATLWDDAIIDFLIDKEVNNICVSLDGATKESYERVRIGADFDVVVGNLNKLIQRKLERGVDAPWLAINMTLMPENRHEQDKLIGEWLGKAHLVSINNTCINHVVPEKFHQPERYPCPFLWEGVHILTNGDVIACCRDSDYEEVMGNAFDTPMMDIWNGSKYKLFRRLHATKQWDAIPICARCDTWMCKTKKTVGEGNRMVLQYPFYRQYVVPSGQMVDHSVAAALNEIWATVSDSTKKAAGMLLSLTPLWRKAS